MLTLSSVSGVALFADARKARDQAVIAGDQAMAAREMCRKHSTNSEQLRLEREAQLRIATAMRLAANRRAFGTTCQNKAYYWPLKESRPRVETVERFFRWLTKRFGSHFRNWW